MRTLCYALLLVWVVPLCWTRSCEHTHNEVQRRQHELRLRRFLDPIQDTAVLLSREVSQSAHPEALHFAHRLLRVHDNFTAACFDHHWFESLNHKLCASFLRWEPWLAVKCHAKARYTGVGSLEDCLCAGMSELLHACRHHVVAWAPDERFCDTLLRPPTRRASTCECEHSHPFGGLCAMLHTSAVDRPPATPHTPTSAQLHRTSGKHASWKRLANKVSATRFHENSLHKLAQQNRTIKRGGRREPVAPRANTTLYLGSLTRLRRHGGGRDRLKHSAQLDQFDHFDHLKCDKYTEQELRLCAPRSRPALIDVLAWWAPRCQISQVDTENIATSVSTEECHVLISWLPDVLRAYHNSQTAYSIFRDPTNLVTRLVPTTDTTFAEASREYTHAVSTTCRRWSTGHKILPRNEWFDCM